MKMSNDQFDPNGVIPACLTDIEHIGSLLREAGITAATVYENGTL